MITALTRLFNTGRQGDRSTAPPSQTLKLDTGSFQKHTWGEGCFLDSLVTIKITVSWKLGYDGSQVHCCQGMGSQKSFVFSHVKSPVFILKACHRRETLFLLGHYFIVNLFCKLCSTSWVTEEVNHHALCHFQSIWIVLLSIKCSQQWDRLRPPSPDDYLDFSMSETVLFLFRPNMTIWGMMIYVSIASIWKNEAGNSEFEAS